MGVQLVMPVLSYEFGKSSPGEVKPLWEPLDLLILLHSFLPLVIHTMCFPLVFALHSPSGPCSLQSLLTIARMQSLHRILEC